MGIESEPPGEEQSDSGEWFDGFADLDREWVEIKDEVFRDHHPSNRQNLRPVKLTPESADPSAAEIPTKPVELDQPLPDNVVPLFKP